MYDRMQTLSQTDMEKIHRAAMEILETTGVAFYNKQALEIFRQNDFIVEDAVVRFTESQIQKALETVPEKFMVHARNPKKSVVIGGDDFVFLPGYGAPFIMEADGCKRSATMEDYDNFCKLIQSSPHIDMNGCMMVAPSDMPPKTLHLDLHLSNMLLCDKPFMGSPVSRQAVVDGIEMAAILWGGKEELADKTVSVSQITSLSPLQFEGEMVGCLIELARRNQACVITSLIMAGGSGPVTLGGVLALQNAEILAGITLTQLVRPGTPVVYGSTSSAMDLKSGTLSIGAPELSQNVHLVAQMARFYNLPSRSGGGLTDGLCTDAQAGVESTLALSTAARSGIHFILHSCGILASYMAMSFEKFIVDEELCGLVRHMFRPVDLSDRGIDVETICQVGIGGQYLTHPKTYQLCRTEFHMPGLMSRQSTDAWGESGRKRIDQIAQDRVAQRLAAYEKPDIDPEIEKLLTQFVENRKTS
ncbi:MAG: trimethylamine methyltransferase family protein [Desulfobacterales bacterium]|nr:trimethylamine methyltransferase family protein [Desulfobacterales bacterium]